MLFARGSFRSGLRTVGHDGHPCCGASAGPFNRAPRPLALKYIDADFLGDPVHHRAAFLGEFVAERHEFFRRLADAFKKEHAETLSIRRDSNQAVTDTLSTSVNLAGNVADILEQIDRKEKQSTRDNHDAINREVRDLQITNARLALRSSQQLNDIHQRERQAMQLAINQAMQARQNLLWQIGLRAIVAITAAVILVYYICRATQKELIYRENLEEANEEIRRIMNQRERLLLTITPDIKAPAASISGFIDLMKDYVDNPQGISCLNSRTFY